MRYLPVVPKKYVTVDGVATLVHHRGPTTLPGAPPTTELGATIVCCHDAGTDGNQFADLMDALAGDHSPMAYDQPGHGRSAELDSLGSVPAMVTHLRALAQTWDLPPTVLVGEGLGAAVALEAAARHPEWVAAVVAVGDTAPTYDLTDEIASLTAITSGKARRDFDRSGYAPDTDRSVYQKAFGNWVKTDPRATLGDRKAQAEWRLPDGVAAPTLVVIGEHTEPERVEPAEAVATAVANGTTIRLDGAGRRGVLEQPEALAAAINQFLSGANGGRS
ncbi:MAG: alpha/beta hydrolase [Actinomycetota bacterium]